MKNNGKLYSVEEKELIIKTYKENIGVRNGWLDILSKKLNRQKSNISRFIRTNTPDGVQTNSKRTVVFNVKRNILPEMYGDCSECGVRFHKKTIKQKACGRECGIKLNAKLRVGKLLWEGKQHPRGMLGKKQSLDMKTKTSIRVKKEWADPSSKFNSEENKQKSSDRMSKMMVSRVLGGANVYSRTTKGWVEFGGGKRFYFRSKWEMNYARYLEWLKKKKEIKEWDYEVKTFWFLKIMRGVRSYTPDFFVTNNNGTTEYHEVKGWLDPKSKTKLARMSKYYPDIKVILIGESEYKALAKWGKMIGFE